MGTGTDADPLYQSCVTSPGWGNSHAAPCPPETALWEPATHAKHTPFVFVPCSAQRWDAGRIMDGWG